MGQFREGSPVDTSVTEFLEFLAVEKGASGNTIAAYRNDLGQMEEFLSSVGKQNGNGAGVPWLAINQNQVFEYILHLKAQSYAEATVARKVAAVKSFFSFLQAEGMQLHHIKAHGAFFAFLRDEPAVADAVAKAIAAFGDVMLYWPAPAEGVAFCDAVLAQGIEIVEEIYPDLTYAPDGRLVIERHKQAADPGFAAAQVRQFLEDGTVMANDGSTRISFPDARSACVHGDATNAVAVAEAVGAAARAAGRELAAVTP